MVSQWRCWSLWKDSGRWVGVLVLVGRRETLDDLGSGDRDRTGVWRLGTVGMGGWMVVGWWSGREWDSSFFTILPFSPLSLPLFPFYLTFSLYSPPPTFPIPSLPLPFSSLPSPFPFPGTWPFPGHQAHNSSSWHLLLFSECHGLCPKLLATLAGRPGCSKLLVSYYCTVAVPSLPEWTIQKNADFPGSGGVGNGTPLGGSPPTFQNSRNRFPEACKYPAGVIILLRHAGYESAVDHQPSSAWLPAGACCQSVIPISIRRFYYARHLFHHEQA